VTEQIGGFAVSVDRASPVPLYFQVATQLEEMIESGEMPVGGRLANEVELADRLGVSRPTMRRAIQYLVERGMLVRKRGVGTQIVHPKVRRPVELSSLYDDLVKTGQAPATEVLDFTVGPATQRMAELAGVPEGLEVSWFERLRTAGGEPLALMHNAVPTAILPLERTDLEQRGLYELLRAAGHVPRMATQVVGARAANAAEARVLGESRGAPLLTMSRTAWDERGEAVEYGAHVYRASRYSFELSLTV
jgi:DNA-binding GntR family transcriptional regulator